MAGCTYQHCDCQLSSAVTHAMASLENRQAQLRYSMEERKAQVAVSSCRLPDLCCRSRRQGRLIYSVKERKAR